MGREDAWHQNFEDVKLQFVVMRHKGQNRQEEKNHWEKTQEKVPGNARSLPSQGIFEDRIGIDGKHPPERNPQIRNVNIIKKVFDLQEKTLYFFCHSFIFAPQI